MKLFRSIQPKAAQETTTSEVSPGEVSPLVIVGVDFEAGFILIRNDGDEDTGKDEAEAAPERSLHASADGAHGPAC